jgi:hypothetical protein
LRRLFLTQSGGLVVGAFIVALAFVAFAMPRAAARRTSLVISSNGFELEALNVIGGERTAGTGHVRARIFAVEREHFGVFAPQRAHLPADVDSRVWELTLQSADGTRVIVGRELTPYELRWLAERIESVQDSSSKARA